MRNNGYTRIIVFPPPRFFPFVVKNARREKERTIKRERARPPEDCIEFVIAVATADTQR